MKKALGLLLALGIMFYMPFVTGWVDRVFIYDYKGSSVVYLTGERSGGTGSVVQNHRRQKYTLTNAHICRLQDKDGYLNYEKNNGDKGKIKVIEVSNTHDLCVLEAVPGLRPLSIAKSLEKHEKVWLIGHPALRPLTLENGYFVQYTDIDVMTQCNEEQLKKAKDELDKEMQELNKQCKQPTIDCVMKLFNLISIQMRLQQGYCVIEYSAGYINAISYGGNSGSPVLNKWGNIIGVLFAGSGTQNTASYIVPIHFVRKFISKKRK